MSTTLERQSDVDQNRSTDHLLARDQEQHFQSDAATRLRGETTAVRLHIRWLGTRKSLSEPQRKQVASAFEADTSTLTAAKKLIDTSHPAYRALTAIRSQACAYWKSETLPFVEPGVRLLKRERIEKFDARMREFESELTAAVEGLESHYAELVDQARRQLGNLFNSEDYPASLEGLFELRWDYPSCSTPDYLRSVSPELYEAECQRVRERFDDAVRLAESAFAEELQQLVGHLAERLSGNDDGKPKIFRDSAVTNLLEFLERFQRLNIRSDEQLDALVDQARGIVGGVDPQSLRDQAALADRVRQQLGQVSESLDGWMTDRPRRNILRRAR